MSIIPNIWGIIGMLISHKWSIKNSIIGQKLSIMKTLKSTNVNLQTTTKVATEYNLYKCGQHGQPECIALPLLLQNVFAMSLQFAVAC